MQIDNFYKKHFYYLLIEKEFLKQNLRFIQQKITCKEVPQIQNNLIICANNHKLNNPN